MTAPHLTLIDGSGFIFRAYHRLPPLTDPAGTPVGAVFGFTSMLWNLIDDAIHSPEEDYFAVILDAGKSSFRNDMYPEYKAHRPDPPADLTPQFPLIRDAVRALGVPCIERDQLEADDLIASYAEAGIAAGMTVTIVSSDKDLMQLIRPGLSLLDTMQGKRFHTEHVVEKFGVPPERLGDVLALMGDAVDNVPGVPGIGPKTAAELIQTHGDLEGVLAAIDSIKRPKLREMLTANAELARLSRRLVELKRDCELDPPLAGLKLADAIDAAPLAAFLSKHGFRSLLAKLGKDVPPASPRVPGDTAGVGRSPADDVGAPPAEPIDRSKYETVTTLDRLDWWLAEARRVGTVAFDTETTSLDSMRADLVGFSLATAAGAACYVPLAHVAGEGLLAEPVTQIDRDAALRRLRPLLADAAVLKIGQNIKYDLIVMRRQKVDGAGLDIAPFDDTMLLSYALDAGNGQHGMDELSDKHLGHQPIAFKEVAGSGKTLIGFARVPLDRATEYAAEDADVTWRLHALLKPRLHRAGVTRAYEWCDRPLVPVLADMEMAGIKVDRAELARLSAAYSVEIERLEGVIFEAADGPFQIGSPKQLGDVLFERLGLPGGRRLGKSGQYATDVQEMERLAGVAHPKAAVPKLVLEWRQLTKLKNTYTEALQQQINPDTGRVHTSFSMASAVTGRLASSDPNLQNIPIRTPLGRRIRYAFVAEPGHVILAADYNQIELRLMAHMADVPALKEAYAAGADIHALTARQMFDIPDGDPVDRDQRSQAKTINFAVIYGISAFGLATRLGVDRPTAQRFIDVYFDRFPGIRRYIAETIAQVREQGYVTTLFGRRAHMPLIRSKQQGDRQFAERAAVNAPVQGTSADLIKRAMIRMMPALRDAGCTGTRMLLQVHDELVFEAPDAEVAAASAVIKTVMAGAALPHLDLSVPLGVEIGTGASWGDAH